MYPRMAAWRAWRRGGTLTAFAVGMALALSTAVTATAALAGAQPAGLCGRTGDVSHLLLELQKPTAERLWRDAKLFIVRDRDDGALWAFSIKNSTVHPAVRCRRPVQGGVGPGFDVGQICPAGEAACASFAEQVDEKFAAFGPSSGTGSAPR